MTDTQTLSSPAPMEGRGFYNRSSRVQAAGFSPAVPLLEQAARAAPLARAPEPITIADYGASEGRNSLAVMETAIRALRDRVGSERAISVVHADLPANDFSTLFQTLLSDSGSYLRDDPAAFASAVGCSFYQQILPAESVTLGWSSWSLQWLNQTPAPIPDQIVISQSHDAAARAAYTRQSATDWRAFLASRVRELRPGGRLVVLTMALDDDGNFAFAGMIQTMYAVLMALAAEGFVSAAEVQRMEIPIVGRSHADLVAPFADNGRFAGLSVEHVDVFNGED